MAVRIEGRVGKRRVVLLVGALWWSVCALSLLLIGVTIAFHLITRYDWYFNGSFQPWRMLTVEALGALGAPILGGLIVWRQPANRYGWIWCVFGLGLAVRGAGSRDDGLERRRGLLAALVRQRLERRRSSGDRVSRRRPAGRR